MIEMENGVERTTCDLVLALTGVAYPCEKCPIKDKCIYDIFDDAINKGVDELLQMLKDYWNKGKK